MKNFAFGNVPNTALSCHAHKLRPLLYLLLLGFARADSFLYDDSGRLLEAVQGNGLVHGYLYDAEGNLLEASFSSTDMTLGGGPGNGMADWWEHFYFDARDIDPLAFGADRVPWLLKFAAGIDPLALEGQPAGAFAEVDGENLSLTFRRARAAMELVFLVQRSEDLVVWTDLTSETAAALAGPPVVGLSDEVADAYLVSTPVLGSKMFLRLKVRRP